MKGTTIEKRFKILALLVLYLPGDNLAGLMDKIEDLGNKIDQKHPQAAQALSWYEDNIIRILSEVKSATTNT